MTSELPVADEDLVAGVLAGDRQAFAGVYERYADRLFDFAHSMTRNREEAADCVADAFVVMAEKLEQLRDASRLRPWLYSVVRNECLRTLRARARVAHDDEWLEAMPDDGFGPEQQVERDDSVEELRELVWSAVEGLNDRDRALLDLHLRQGLDGADLAAAMDVTTANSYVMLSRARDQVERALGALLIARRGSKDCDELADLLRDWDGTFSPLIRKRVARHIDGCGECESRRKVMVSPLALLAGVPLIGAPALLKDRVLDDPRLVAFYADTPSAPLAAGAGGDDKDSEGRGALWSWRSGLVAASVAVLLGLGGWWALGAGDDDAVLAVDGTATSRAPSEISDPTPSDPVPATPSDPPSASTPPSSAPTETMSESPSASESESVSESGSAATPGDLAVSSRSVRIESGAASTTFTVRNTGGSPVQFSAKAGARWLGANAATTRLAAGRSTTVRVTADRTTLAEGTSTSRVTVSWNGRSIPVSVTVVVDKAPQVGAIAAEPGDCVGSGRVATVAANVTDGTGVSSVTVRWDGPSGASGQSAATRSGERWSATVGGFPVGGTVSVTVTATDTAGHRTSASRTFSIDPCPG